MDSDDEDEKGDVDVCKVDDGDEEEEVEDMVVNEKRLISFFGFLLGVLVLEIAID